MNKSTRYQIFVSSTFSDLISERSEVIQALWELDCIPTGMEAFLATNESQWDVIRKVIDECDYYVLIIGGRYGSIAEDGVSYTEKEYSYAKSIGVPVLAFVHGDPDSIPVAKSEKMDVGKARLEAFRKRVMSEHPIRRWKTPQELGGIVSRSVSREMKINPRLGWVRNTGTSSVELLEQINELRKENERLKEDGLKAQSLYDVSDLESGSDTIEIFGEAIVILHTDEYGINRFRASWSYEISWDSIFKYIGPILINEHTESEMQAKMSSLSDKSKDIDRKQYRIASSSISGSSHSSILIQLRALGFIEKGVKRRALSDKESYWKLTDKGDRYLQNLLARKKKE